MGKQLTFILGGARSGKSAYAETLARQGQQVLYVATAEAWDEEMKTRIARHRAERPAHWHTVEAPLHVGETIAAGGKTADFVLIDCLTLLANNVFMQLPEPVTVETAEPVLRAEIESILHVYAASTAEWVIVSNEVGLGIVPAYPLGRVYRDVLGRVNQMLARQADQVIFMVAGLPMVVKDKTGTLRPQEADSHVKRKT